MISLLLPQGAVIRLLIHTGARACTAVVRGDQYQKALLSSLQQVQKLSDELFNEAQKSHMFVSYNMMTDIRQSMCMNEPCGSR